MTDQSRKLSLVRIRNDAAETKSVFFGFEEYADTLAGLIVNPKNQTPLVIGVYGPWGSGKTTLMKAIQGRLDGPKATEFGDKINGADQGARNCKTVWFQAWKYDKENEILAGLLDAIFQTMSQDDFFSQAKGQIEKLAKGINKLKILGFVSKLASGVDISEFFKELDYKKQLGFYDVFDRFLKDLIYTYLSWRMKVTPSDKPDDKKGALVIFIDDLDRCPQPRIVKVLETIKLFMDHKGCVFVIGAAQDIIIKALADNYKDDANRFMEKIVQVTFNLPKLSEQAFYPYLEKLVGDQEEIKSNLDLIIPAMGGNPRQLKRFINNLNLRHGLMRSSGITINLGPVLHWGILEHAFPEFTDFIKERPNNLFVIKEHLETIAQELGDRKFWKAEEDRLDKLKIGPSLKSYILNESLVKIIDILKIDPTEFTKLITFSDIVESEVSGAETPKEQLRVGSRNKTMVEILPGRFKFGEKPKNDQNWQDDEIKAPYWIDLYLVTNARYKAFIDAGGYETEKWWKKHGGWDWREEEGIIRPEYWNDERFNQSNHPVVGVSWFEAAAFCAWLSEASKDAYEYHLPNEKQWERAARGTDGREYPWEGDFDPNRCNTRESGKGTTTRVDIYEDGKSPEGCYDMAGNVWEWTSDFFDNDKDSYVIKGGSWIYTAENARCANRDSNNPDSRFSSVGFRCARTL